MRGSTELIRGRVYRIRRFLQEKFGNRWALVAAELEGKTGQQCAQRWRHKVNPNIRKEKWSEEEDKKVSRRPTALRCLRSSFESI